MFTPITTSLLETDLYKFTMLQTMFHRLGSVHAEYEFICRNQPLYPLATLVGQVNEQLDHLCTLTFTDGELDYLRSLRFIKPDFVDFLSIFRLQRKHITAKAVGDRLSISAAGPQVHVMMFELYVLPMVNELYFTGLPGDKDAILAEGRRRLAAKVEFVKTIEQVGDQPFEFFDFGLRRRYSGAWHREVIETLRNVPNFRGTSNVLFAKEYGLTPFGSMAHEFLQTHQALNIRLRDFQRAALETWCQEYRGDLGIALTDTVGMDAFLEDFDLYMAKLFDGLRHDSGDPFLWAEKALAHYDKLRIDPKGKRLVWSDSLNLGTKSAALYQRFAARTRTGFGIGTDLTNDLGPEPLSLVMKLVRANGNPVAKLSDSPGKTLCDDKVFLDYLRQVFNVPRGN